MPIQLPPPPAQNNYNYGHFTNPSITNPQINATAVGDKIDPKYDQGAWTPAQKTRITSISLTAAAVLATIAAIYLAVATSSIPFIFVATVLGAASVYGVYFIFTRGPDLDNPTVRQEHITLIAAIAFKDLAAGYNLEDVAGYGLLAQRVAPLTPNDARKVYTYVNALLMEKRKLDAARDQDFSRVRQRYDLATAPAREVHDARQDAATWRRVGINVALDAVESSNNGPSLFSAMTRIGYNIGESVNQRHIEHDYQASTIGWQAWLSNEEQHIQQAYDHAVSGPMENHFVRAFVNPNAITVI